MFRVVSFLSVLAVLIRYGNGLMFVFMEFVKSVLEIMTRITQKQMEACLLPQPSQGRRAERLPPSFSAGLSPIQNTTGLFYNVPHVISVLLPRKVVGRKNKAQCVEATREGLQNIVLEHSW